MKNKNTRIATAKKLLHTIREQVWALKTLQNGAILSEDCFRYILNNDEELGQRYEDLTFREQVVTTFLYKTIR